MMPTTSRLPTAPASTVPPVAIFTVTEIMQVDREKQVFDFLTRFVQHLAV
jgi:hypothetical protein